MTEIKEMMLSDILKIQDKVRRHQLIVLSYPVLNPDYIRRDLETIKELHNSGIKLPRVILDQAIKAGNLTVLKYLTIEMTIDNKNIDTAIENEQIQILKFLLSIISCNQKNLCLAIMKHKLNIIKILFEYDICCENDILEFVAEYGNLEIFMFFVEKGALLTDSTLDKACRSDVLIVDYIIRYKKISTLRIIDLLVGNKNNKIITDYLANYLKNII